MRMDAYTLIELLAVVVILGLAASLGIPSLLRSNDGRSLNRFCHDIRQAEQNARQLARTHGLFLELSNQGFESSDQGVSLTFQAPVGGSVAWFNSAGRPLRKLWIDRRGHSEDLLVELGISGQQRLFSLSGISGEWSEIPPVLNESKKSKKP